LLLTELATAAASIYLSDSTQLACCFLLPTAKS